MSNGKHKKAKTTGKSGKKSDASVSKIDALIAEAKLKQGNRAKTERSPKAPKQSDPEKEAARLAKQQERDAAKATRDAARAEKNSQRDSERAQKLVDRAAKKAATAEARAQKLADRKPAHLAKLEKAQAKLPVLTEAANAAVEAVKASSLSGPELAAVAQHVDFMARSMQTQAALGAKLKAGDAVVINVGKHAGEVGTLDKVQRIRCFVNVPGVERSVYLFTSDVTPVTPATVEDEMSADQSESTGDVAQAA